MCVHVCTCTCCEGMGVKQLVTQISIHLQVVVNAAREIGIKEL